MRNKNSIKIDVYKIIFLHVNEKKEKRISYIQQKMFYIYLKVKKKKTQKYIMAII